MRRLSYLKAIVVVHGKSEKQLCNWVKSQLRLNIHIESDKNGSKSIQITSLEKLLKNTIYKSLSTFKKHFESVEIDISTKRLNDNFRIFIIMDTDDCTMEQKNRFMNKSMFRRHWLYEYIVPIWNIKNLEEVLIKANVLYQKKNINLKSEYVSIFPTEGRYVKSDSLQIEEFYQKLKACENSNMDEFLYFCINCDV